MIKKYVEENKDRMLEELFSLIRIPSVSAQTAHKEDMVRCAETLEKNFCYKQELTRQR